MSRTLLTDILPLVAMIAILSLVLVPVLGTMLTMGSPLAAWHQGPALTQPTPSAPAVTAGTVQLASAPTASPLQ